MFTACGTGKGAAGESEIPLEDPPIITSATHQHTLYNGQRQPIEAKTAREGAPVLVTYFTSLEALENDVGGTTEPPVEIGDYFVRIERPAGNGFAAGRPVSVEYHLQKALVTINAAEKQRAVYDGLPKTVAAAADKPVDLTIAYYPAGSAVPLDGPPSEPGDYLAKISFAGDTHYMGASKEVEFLVERANRDFPDD
ncbi:MAG: hypothetical protein LBG57_07415 [Treponema sp.]|nr:hypothetical protein [Treponema sp.]